MFYFNFAQRKILFGLHHETKLLINYAIVTLITSVSNIILYTQQLKRQVAWVSQGFVCLIRNQEGWGFYQKPRGLWVRSTVMNVVGLILSASMYQLFDTTLSKVSGPIRSVSLSVSYRKCKSLFLRNCTPHWTHIG